MDYTTLAKQWKQFGVIIKNNTDVAFECVKDSTYDLKISLQTDINTNPYLLNIIEEFIKIEKDSNSNAYLIYRTSLNFNDQLYLFRIKKDIVLKKYYFSCYVTKI